MPNPLIIHNRYVPKVGEGMALRAALQQQDAIWRENDLPGFQLLKPYDGPHHTMITVQRWESFAQWDETRHSVPTIPAARSLVFDTLYPLIASMYESTMFEEIPNS